MMRDTSKVVFSPSINQISLSTNVLRYYEDGEVFFMSYNPFGVIICNCVEVYSKKNRLESFFRDGESESISFFHISHFFL